MQIPFELSLALKFLSSSKEEQSISSVVKICFISILVSTFSLTLIWSIMQGFEKATHQKLQGIHSDITISAQGRPINYKKLKSFLLNSNNFKNNIKAISPSANTQVIVQSKPKSNNINNNSNIDSNTNNLVLIKGINPKSYPKVSAIKDMLVNTYKNEKDWVKLLSVNNSFNNNLGKIFIGQTLAKYLHVKVGDELDILYSDDETENNKVILQAQKAKVTGIFKSGVNEFDEHVILTSLDFLSSIFSSGPNSGINEINIRLKNSKYEKSFIKQLQSSLDLSVMSWKDLYPAIVSALHLEKVAMIIIFSLVTLIAIINIMSLLFMFISQKKGEIALLKSMGMSDNSISSVFIFLSLVITIVSSAIGIILAWILCFFIDKYKIISLPDAYYINYLPAQMDWKLALIILVSVTFISLIVTLVPTNKIKNIKIAQVLKTEY